MIRAVHDGATVRVYQAYGDAIAEPALERGTFVGPPFRRERMTWIKPSFLWMMYRSGWGLKEPGQSRLLAIDVTREGFEWALANARLAHRRADDRHAGEAPVAPTSEDPVRIQWDPERDLRLEPLPERSIQIGLRGEAVDRYVDRWIVRIEEITDRAHEIRALVEAGELARAARLLPPERVYPLDEALRRRIGATG